MKSGTINYFLSAIILCFFSISTTFGQGGMNIYTGIAANFNKDKNVTPEGTGHYGYFVGVDGRLNSGDLYFAGGLRYHRTSLMAESSKSFFSNEENFAVLVFRGGFGFNLKHFSHKTRLRSKIFGAFNMASNSPETRLETVGYEKLNDSWGGLTSGLGMDIGAITLDLEYHKGFVNAYNGQPGTKFDTWSFAVGFFF